MLLPIRMGNSSRSDLQAIAASLLAARGDAVTNQVGSVIWTEAQAHARAIYNIWAANQKLSNQFNPYKMSDFLPRWETILGLAPVPTDTLATRRSRIAAKFLQLGSFPTTRSVIDVLTAALPNVFQTIINTTPVSSTTTFPGGSNIVGGPDATNGPWYSDIAHIAVDCHEPAYMTDYQFFTDVSQIFGILSDYLPAWTTFDWFSNQFTDDGYAGDTGLITGTVGSTTLTSVNTRWNTPVNTDGTHNLVAGSVLEYLDNAGEWQRVTVASIQSDQHLTLTAGLPSNVTSQRYWIAGVFLDCSTQALPYPPSCHNLDVAGFHI